MVLFIHMTGCLSVIMLISFLLTRHWLRRHEAHQPQKRGMTVLLGPDGKPLLYQPPASSDQ